MSSFVNIGIDSENRTSSRVLKPPGGGHSNIFGQEEPQASKHRPKYNQQNSPNMSAVMGTTDANTRSAEQKNQETPKQVSEAPKQNDEKSESKSDSHETCKKRVPPGGYSAGFW